MLFERADEWAVQRHRNMTLRSVNPPRAAPSARDTIGIGDRHVQQLTPAYGPADLPDQGGTVLTQAVANRFPASEYVGLGPNVTDGLMRFIAMSKKRSTERQRFSAERSHFSIQ